MKEIELSVYIHASREAVFDALSDYDHFFGGGQFNTCHVTRAPGSFPNGVGATREIAKGRLHFAEEITHFSRSERIDYRVTRCSLPLRHEGGSTTLTQRGEGTEVRWTSRFRVPLPIVGSSMARLFGMALVSELTGLLMQAKRELEA